MKTLNLGQSDFKNIIEHNNYFVDKTLFIEEIIKAQTNVLLLPRPRRFGKTLNLSMLRYFFDKNAPKNKNLFKELQIWQADEEVKAHCCKYPVLFLSFKDAKANTWEETFDYIKREISQIYIEHDYLITQNALRDFEKAIFEKIINKTASNADFGDSLKNLSQHLQKYHGENVVILIDEYDAPIQASYKKFYDEAVPFMRNLLSGAFKDNIALYKGVITGILRVSKESIFSGLNNISVHGVLDSKFSDKFGFTEMEVKQILADFEVKTDYEEIKKWYNGYKFGKSESIYNPWSILNYAVEYQDGFKTFWANTSADTLLREQIQKKNADYIREDLLNLIAGQTIKKDLEENFVFSDLEIDNELLWTLLIYSGYLTVSEKVSWNAYQLVIPNYEIKTIFQDTIIRWLRIEVKVRKSLLEKTANHLINNQMLDFEEGFKEIMGDTFSYYDNAKKHEYIYHSYILGLLAIIGDDFIIKSNRESGGGRYDIMLIPHDKSQNGVVIEIKQIEKQKDQESQQEFKDRINQNIEKASLQIDKNQYYKELIENKIPQKNIVKVPIIFAGKEVFVLNIK